MIISDGFPSKTLEVTKKKLTVAQGMRDGFVGLFYTEFGQPNYQSHLIKPSKAKNGLGLPYGSETPTQRASHLCSDFEL